MKYLIIAVLSLSTVLAKPSRFPYPIHPGVGAIYKGPHEETIIEGPDGSVITAESDSAGSIKLEDSAPGVIKSASPAVLETDINLANTGPNLFNSGNEEFRVRSGANSAATYVDAGAGLVNAGDGLVHSGPAIVNTGDGLIHSGQAIVNTGDGLAHSGHAFVNADDAFAHSRQAFANADAALAHSRQAFLNSENELAHSAQAFSNSVDGLAHSAPAFGDGLAHVGQAFANTAQGFANTVDGLIHSGPVLGGGESFAHSGAILGNAAGGLSHSGAVLGGFDGLIHAGHVGGSLVHTEPAPAPVLVNHALPVVAPAIVEAAAPVFLTKNPIVVPDVVEHEQKIVEETVIIGNKVISVPKLVEGNTDLVGPSGTISTRGGDTVISGPASITVKGDGVITEIDKQPDVHIKTVEVKPIVPPVVIKPVAPIATIEHTVISNPIITEARAVLAPKRTEYAASAPVLGINPIVTTKVIDGLNPILSHRPAIIKSGPILADSVATSFAEHNAVFGNPHYAPEFLPLEPFAFKPIYGPLH